MSAYLANRWIRIGLALVLLGWGPLLAIIVLAGIGLWPDPDPNPIGPGLLFFVTCWPAVICLCIGVVQVKRRAARTPPAPTPAPRPPPARRRPHERPGLSGNPWIRIAALAGGAGLCIHGAMTLGQDSSRGPAAAIVVGIACIAWAMTGRIPRWFRR